MNRIFFALFALFPVLIIAQSNYSVKSIPKDLLEGANAVIRFDETVITLDNFNDMTIKTKMVVTVLNRRGLSAVQPFANYSNSSAISKIEAFVYDEQGKQTKKYKKKDFIDKSASGGNLYTDNRVLVLNFVPTNYPFTFEFLTVTKSSSTAFLPRWSPSPLYQVSTEKSKFTVVNERRIPLVTRSFNLKEFNVIVDESPTSSRYEVANIRAVKREILSPFYTEFTPVVKIALRQFQLENQAAIVNNWRDFGNWQNQKLLKDRDKLPEKTKLEVANLVANIESRTEKAKAIYKYMQDKTRYISVQIGIGGWQPSPAMEVDKLGYGDCKGLTNYTMALLDSQGIESYYTIVDAGPNGRDLDEEFVALQGNHVILTVPLEGENIFLECTNQQVPFNYLGSHTDDRKVLMVTPEGGVMTKTHKYSEEDNFTSLNATAVFGGNFELSGSVVEVSGGIPYVDKFYLENERTDNLGYYYKELWSHLNDLKLSNIEFNNNKDEVAFTEKLDFNVVGYVSKAGDRVLLNPNIFTRSGFVPEFNENRSLPLEIRRGYSEKDEIEITLPESYQIESVFDSIEIENEFGNYRASVEKLDEFKVLYKRELVINSGRYPKEKFNDYATFRRDILKKDRSKIVLKQK